MPAEDLSVGQQPEDGPYPRCAAVMRAANMPNNSYSSRKFWGAATYRDLAYGSACSCFTYSGLTRRFS